MSTPYDGPSGPGDPGPSEAYLRWRHLQEQADAPQTLVVAAPTGAEVDSVTMTVVDGGWGTKALTTLVVGIVLLLLGLALLARSFGRLGGRRDRTARPTTEEARA